AAAGPGHLYPDPPGAPETTGAPGPAVHQGHLPRGPTPGSAVPSQGRPPAAQAPEPLQPLQPEAQPHPPGAGPGPGAGARLPLPRPVLRVPPLPTPLLAREPPARHPQDPGGHLRGLEAIAKPRSAQKCHSEQSEESRIFSDLRSFTSFRMTVKSGFAIASS